MRKINNSHKKKVYKKNKTKKDVIMLSRNLNENNLFCAKNIKDSKTEIICFNLTISSQEEKNITNGYNLEISNKIVNPIGNIKYKKATKECLSIN